MEKEKRKKQKVLMPAGIRSKLMAAASMLMVGVIMMVSSTYAWFTLSTAPEVKNISTTVAGNGSLEIALMPTDGLLTSITAGAVGSTATVVQKNTKWGNQIILSDDTAAGDYYGLNSISLNPASLNYTEATEDTEATFAADKPLTIATYGFDGRIAGLSADNIGIKGWNTTSTKFDGGTDGGYGVRAIGELKDNKEVSSTYGYVVDLALRVNTDNGGTAGNLLLQTAAKNRIYDGSTNKETMGGGSTMSFSVPATANLKAGALKDLLRAIRITFVQDYGLSGADITPVVLGTARLDVTAVKDYTNNKNVTDIADADDPGTWTVTTEGTAPIYLYKKTTTTTGGEGNQTTTTTWDKDERGVLLTGMKKNNAYQISAIVWLDGTAVKNANVSAATAQSLTGTLNLQFSTDITLNPAVNTPLQKGA